MNASGIALRGKHTVEARELYMAFELGEKNWKLALGDGACSPSRYTVAAGDTASLLEYLAKAKARCGLAPEASVHSCYEAGRDGFWLHRWLIAQGIDNIVVDSSSIELSHSGVRARPNVPRKACGAAGYHRWPCRKTEAAIGESADESRAPSPIGRFHFVGRVVHQSEGRDPAHFGGYINRHAG